MGEKRRIRRGDKRRAGTPLCSVLSMPEKGANALNYIYFGIRAKSF